MDRCRQETRSREPNKQHAALQVVDLLPLLLLKRDIQA